MIYDKVYRSKLRREAVNLFFLYTAMNVPSARQRTYHAWLR
jgi:hypothetical protein